MGWGSWNQKQKILDSSWVSASWGPSDGRTVGRSVGIIPAREGSLYCIPVCSTTVSEKGANLCKKHTAEALPPLPTPFAFWVGPPLPTNLYVPIYARTKAVILGTHNFINMKINRMIADVSTSS